MESDPLSIACIKAIVLLDPSGKRIFVKYYEEIPNSQKFEDTLWEKAQQQSTLAEDIFVVQKYFCTYKRKSGVFVGFIGELGDNELIVTHALGVFMDVLNELFKFEISRQSLLAHYDLLLYAVDSMVDSGILFEEDITTIVDRVTMKSVRDSIPITEQTFTQALATAKDHLIRSLLR
ncbi:Coatomer subunit zeta (CopZ) [Paratrimastix pyriformis]|uniref:Coatomer subunit zeta n=1 Tax=Paratrimastix pyriformis TaxID=342808 RepID=A0ABQ8US36_9EUKA|nr:Coatomer subunit zeta (CopZ) [Paratrimastix pyriformis]|eukprot:GAFH01005186.1.p2 GENE.GAFH01005186.1~~GAFH01005186.1.p2  ORF type:complete len:191 (-),score=54.98 GAFH01005186.1:103-633(-)